MACIGTKALAYFAAPGSERVKSFKASMKD